MSKRPTPETDKNALLLANLDDWIDDCLRNSKPIGLTLCDARKRISDQSDRIAELWDAMEIIRCERDEAREALRTLAEHGENEIQKLIKECDEARNKMADALQEVDLRTLDFERMKEERDEAREAFSELWQYADALLPEIDEETLNRWNKCIKLY